MADFGWRLHNLKHLASLCLQNLCSLNFDFGILQHSTFTPFPLGVTMPRSLRHDLGFLPSLVTIFKPHFFLSLLDLPSFLFFFAAVRANCGRVQRTLISCGTYRAPRYRQTTTWTNWTRLVMIELNDCTAHWSWRIRRKSAAYLWQFLMLQPWGSWDRGEVVTYAERAFQCSSTHATQ